MKIFYLQSRLITKNPFLLPGFYLMSLSPDFYLMMVVSIIIAFTVHEYFHAQTAYFLGDPTPKTFGRLTLNPLAHFDPIFTTLIFIFGVGMGKPVPINPLNFKNKRWGSAIVAAAGPLSNIFLALFCSIFLRLMPHSSFGLLSFFELFIWINLSLAVFNLIPLPPLDGSHILFALFPFSFDNYFLAFILAFFAFIFMVTVGQPIIVEFLFRLFTGLSFY